MTKAEKRDQYVEHWMGVFQHLEQRHRIRSAHAVPFALFMRDPEGNARWIEIYFANPVLFAGRPGGCAITLAMFLREGPEAVTQAVMVIEGVRREAAGLQADQSLLPRQQSARASIDLLHGQTLQEQIDNEYEATHIVEHRGDRYVEPYHRPPLHKFHRSKNPHVSYLLKSMAGALS